MAAPLIVPVDRVDPVCWIQANKCGDTRRHVEHTGRTGAKVIHVLVENGESVDVDMPEELCLYGGLESVDDSVVVVSPAFQAFRI